MSQVKNRRLNNPNQIKAMLTEQANILRQDETLDPIDRARALTYISNTALSCYKDGELTEKVNTILEQLDIK